MNNKQYQIAIRSPAAHVGSTPPAAFVMSTARTPSRAIVRTPWTTLAIGCPSYKCTRPCMQTIGTPAGYEDHLSRFSNCAFAGLARAKLAASPPPSTEASGCSAGVDELLPQASAERTASPLAPMAASTRRRSVEGVNG